jgi:hypothetical protein
MRALGVLLVLLLNGWVAAAQEARSDYLTHPVCDSVNNTFRCVRAIEALQSRAAQGGFARSGDTLLVDLTSEGQALLVDGEHPHRSGIPEYREAASYSFVGLLGGTSFALIHAQFSEGNAYGLLHLGTGQYSEVEGFPMTSPDNERLLISENGYFNRIGVFIYRVEDDAVELEWSLTDAWDGWVPGPARWHGGEAIVDRLAMSLPGGPEVVVGQLVIGRIEGRWVSEVR